MQYVFTAVFSKDVDGTLLVNFPDLPGCQAQGKDMITAVQNAESVLRLCLFDMEQHGIKIPKTRYPDDLHLPEGDIASVIFTNTDPYHERFANKIADHTIAVPAWLGQIAENSNLDLSQIFQDAVKREIGMPIHKSSKTGELAIKPIMPPLKEIKAPVDPSENYLTRTVAAPDRNRGAMVPAAQVSGPRASRSAVLYQDVGKNTDRKFFYLVSFLVVLLILVGTATLVVTQTDFVYQRWFAPDQEAIAEEDMQQMMLMQAIQAAREAAEREEAERAELEGNNQEEGQLGEGMPTPPTPGGEPTELQALRIYYNNADIVGRITIDGTTITNIPVVQTDNNDFFRSHDIRLAPSPYGWVFVDEATDLRLDNNNIVLHGSSALPGSLFSYLPNFADSATFGRSPLIRLETEIDTFMFEIFSFYEDDTDFPLGQTNFQGWDQWIHHFAELSWHDSPVFVLDTDRIITLVSYRDDGSGVRYVLHARMI